MSSRLSRVLKDFCAHYIFKWGEGCFKIELNTNHAADKRFVIWTTNGISKVMLGESDTINGAKRIINNVMKEYNLFNHWGCPHHNGTDLVGYDYGFLTPEKKVEWENKEPPFVV